MKEQVAAKDEEVRRLGERWEWERSDILRSAQIEHFQELDQQRKKWEAREERLVEQLESGKRGRGGVDGVGGRDERVEETLKREVEREVEALKAERDEVIRVLTGEKEELQ